MDHAGGAGWAIFVCGLHKVYSRIMARSDLCTRVERLSRGKPHMYSLRTYFMSTATDRKTDEKREERGVNSDRATTFF